MKKFAAIIFVFIFCSLVYGQGSYFAHKNYTVQPDVYTRVYGDGKPYSYKVDDTGAHDYAFPIFSNQANKYAANKINQMLQISELGLLKGFEKKSIFEDVSYDGGGLYGAKIFISYKVYDNSQKVLSVRFNETSSGATLHYWTTYYNFNAGNGDLVQLKDMFTEEGFQKFVEFVSKRRIAEFKRQLVRKVARDERDDYTNITECYAGDDDLEDYHIKGNFLYIDGDNCLAKGQGFSGMNMESGFKPAEFKAYLNDYGKSFFSITKDLIKKYRSDSLPQLFHGTIAGQRVSLVLDINAYSPEWNEVRGAYVYSKFGHGIYLDGTIDAGELTLKEMVPTRRDTGFMDNNGFITAKFDGKSIAGTWANKDKTTTHNFSLIRK